MRQRTKRALGGLLVTLVLSLLATVALLHTSWGEERVRVLVEGAVNPSGAPARVKIGRLGDFELFSPLGVVRGTAEELSLVDAEGAEVLHINEVTAEIQLSTLLRRQFYIRKASISGAQIVCDIETGRPLIGAQKPAPRRKVFVPRSMDVYIDNVEIVGLYAVATQADGQRVILGRLAGRIDLMALGATPGVKITVFALKGVMSHPQAVRLHDATGVIDTSAETAADLKFSADASGASLTGRLRYIPGDKADPVKVDIEKIRDFDPSMLGNPLDAMNGAGVPVDMFRKMLPSGAQSFP